MGIRFLCPNGHKLNVKEFQAGRKGICPFCGAKIQIPTHSTRPSSREQQGQMPQNTGFATTAAGSITSDEAGGDDSSTSGIALAAPPATGGDDMESLAATIAAQVMPAPAGPLPTILPMTPPAEVESPISIDHRSAASGKSGPSLAPVAGAAPNIISAPMVSPVPVVAMSTPAAPAAPAAPTAAPVAAAPAMVDPLLEAGDVVWYVRPPSGGQFGPAGSDVMRAWLGEGRISGDSLVWREGWRDWLEAGEVFPQLQAQSAAATGAANNSAMPTFTQSTAFHPHAEHAKTRPWRTKDTIVVALLAAAVVILLIVFLVVLLK